MQAVDGYLVGSELFQEYYSELLFATLFVSCSHRFCTPLDDNTLIGGEEPL